VRFALLLLTVPMFSQEFVGTVRRVTNPPQNVFVIQTKGIAEIGALCLERIVVKARLLSGERNHEGDEVFVKKTYILELMEQHNGITRPRSVDLGPGKLLTMEVQAYPLINDFICGTKRE
jgi:hypothetical protein